jgi:hypothetical protein
MEEFSSKRTEKPAYYLMALLNSHNTKKGKENSSISSPKYITIANEQKELGVPINTGVTVLGKVMCDRTNGSLLMSRPAYLGNSKMNILKAIETKAGIFKWVNRGCKVAALGCGIWFIKSFMDWKNLKNDPNKMKQRSLGSHLSQARTKVENYIKGVKDKFSKKD